VTEHRKPPACHFDRALGERVTREHRDDCPNPATHGGCVPCTAPHCAVCGREHLDNVHPISCEKCVIATLQDLDEILAADAQLGEQAVEGEGLAYASAPIPGHNAAVLRGPSVRLDRIQVSPDTHRPQDPIPPLAVLAQWEDIWRAWFEHDVEQQVATTAKWGEKVRGPRRATLAGAIAYLRGQVPTMAQGTDGPDWLKFTHQVRALRSRLEHQLHDERQHELGVECFECGDQLVRRFRTRKTCQHPTPARLELARWLRLGYPEALTRLDARAARVPCGRCSQGGLDDPSAGQSWECPGCRKQYDSAAYATAVRRDLLDDDAGDGWTHITMAAEAATTLTGHLVPAATVRKWMDRGKVAALCVWRVEQDSKGRPVVPLRPVPWGMRLVFWPDVADAAVDAVRRMLELEQERRRRAQEYADWSKAVLGGEDPHEAGARLEVHPSRVEAFILEHEKRERIGA